MSNDLPGIEYTPEVPEGKTTLPYVSKSRVKTYKQCPRKFFWKYWAEERGPPTYYTEKGTQIHKAFEVVHENLLDYVNEHGRRPPRFTPLLGDWRNYAQWTEYIGSFFVFEERRWQAALQSMVDDGFTHDIDEALVGRWVPVEVEAEAWLGEPPTSWVDEHGEPDYVSGEPPVGDIPWMGRADLIVDTRSVPGVQGDGVVIIDYKTGSVQDEQYRDEGIYLEGEYYGWLFQSFFDVDAVAGYYPKTDELVTSPYPSGDRKAAIAEAVAGMQQPPDIENYRTNKTPLCHYNNSKNEGQCWFHDVCEVRHDCRHCPDEPDGGDNAPRYQ